LTEPSYIFDLETKFLAHEVGGWSHIDRLGLSAAVLMDAHGEGVHHFLEDDAEALISRLTSASHVVGFNLLRFDYVVLKPYGLRISPELRAKTTDLLEDVYQELGFRLSLDNLAGATLGTAKSADGLQAVQWYREGRLDQVLAYCEDDVRVTKALWQYGRKKKRIHYHDRNAGRRTLSVNW
jgi:DEAD/DEAH box helicase domain-containing protein